MFKQFIGKRSTKVKNVVERSAVKKFAEAIGDLQPIYLDEESGKNSRYQTNIAPPTFPRVFHYGEIEGLYLANKKLIHGEQTFHYQRPLLVGEEILCYAEVTDFYERKGNNGRLGFLVVNNNGENLNGNSIFTSKLVVIITEDMRKGLTL